MQIQRIPKDFLSCTGTLPWTVLKQHILVLQAGPVCERSCINSKQGVPKKEHACSASIPWIKNLEEEEEEKKSVTISLGLQSTGCFRLFPPENQTSVEHTGEPTEFL